MEATEQYGSYRGYPLWKSNYTMERDSYDRISFWFSDDEGYEVCSFETEKEMLTYIDNFKEVEDGF